MLAIMASSVGYAGYDGKRCVPGSRMSRYLDMNPFMAMLFGGGLGGTGMSSFLPWMFWGNLW